MRYLAIARFRLLTTIRGATPLFVLSAVSALGPAALMSYMPTEEFRANADQLLGEAATASVAAWVWHALILAFACNAFGSVKLLRPQITSVQTDAPGDLIDTAPIRPGARFWGEAAGIFAAAMTIHICTLPVLTLVAALSPLPTRMFVFAEAAIIALVVLASTGGAWKRRAPRTRWNATRGPRSAVLFAVLLLMALRPTTERVTFRDSFGWFVTHPSQRSWSAVSNAVENPLLLFVLLSLLYTSYIAFYYKSSVRTARR